MRGAAGEVDTLWTASPLSMSHVLETPTSAGSDVVVEAVHSVPTSPWKSPVGLASSSAEVRAICHE
jgi:hypothetical protein